MKISYILNSILLLFFSQSVILSQSTWEYFNGQEQNWSRMTDIFELPGGNLVSINDIFIQDNNNIENHNFSILRIHDKNTGEVLNEVEYKNDSLSTSLHLIFYNLEKETFIICGSVYKMIDNNIKRSYFISTIWDKNLNFISDTLLNLIPENINHDLWFINGKVAKNGDLIVLVNYSPIICYYDSKNKLMFVRMNNSGQILQNEVYFENSGNVHCTMIEDNEEYFFPGKKTLYFDKDLELKDSTTNDFTQKNILTYNYNAVIFDDNKYNEFGEI